MRRYQNFMQIKARHWSVKCVDNCFWISSSCRWWKLRIQVETLNLSLKQLISMTSLFQARSIVNGTNKKISWLILQAVIWDILCVNHFCFFFSSWFVGVCEYFSWRGSWLVLVSALFSVNQISLNRIRKSRVHFGWNQQQLQGGLANPNFISFKISDKRTN